MTTALELTGVVGDSAVVQSARPAKRWLILLLAWLLLFDEFGRPVRLEQPVIASTGELGFPLAQLATFVTAYFVGYVASNCISGMLTDGSTTSGAERGRHWHRRVLRWPSDFTPLLLGWPSDAVRNGPSDRG